QKFRIRSYYPNPTENDPVFLEIKEKRGQSIFKRRAAISMKDVGAMLSGQKLGTDNSVCDEWRSALIRNSLKPKIMNKYTRLAFVSSSFPGLRITIDKEVQYAMTSEVRFDLPTRNVT